MTALLITGIEGAENCANAMSKLLGFPVETAAGRKEALIALRRNEYTVLVVDETVAEGDPSGAELIWKNAGTAIPMQVNFAIAGTARLVRDIKAALSRRDRELRLAEQAARTSLNNELRSTVAGLLLQSQLALAESNVAPQISDKLRMIVELTGSLKLQIGAPGVN